MFGLGLGPDALSDWMMQSTESAITFFFVGQMKHDRSILSTFPAFFFGEAFLRLDFLTFLLFLLGEAASDTASAADP